MQNNNIQTFFKEKALNPNPILFNVNFFLQNIQKQSELFIIVSRN